MPGDRVLIRNVGLKGKNKLADKWEKDVYLIVEQPNKQIPVYVVKREHGRGATKMLHRNLLLPFMALPLSKPGADSTVEPSNSSQPSPVEVETVGDNLGSNRGHVMLCIQHQYQTEVSRRRVLWCQCMLYHRGDPP